MSMAFMLSAQLSNSFGKSFKDAGDTVGRLGKSFQNLQKFSGDVSGVLKAQEALNAAQNKVADARAKLDRLNAGIGENGVRVQATKAQIQAATREHERASVVYAKQQAALDRLSGSSRAYGMTIGQLMSKEKELQSVMRRATVLAEKRATNQVRMQNAWLNVSMAGSASSALGSGINSQLKGMVSVGMEFEKQMASVRAVSGASAEEFAQMQALALELGNKTEWSASQAAQGMQYLAMAGFKTEESLKAMPGMLSLATAGGIDLGKAADVASNILTGFGLAADQMGRAGDVLVNTFTSSNTTLEMLGDTMKYAAPVAKSLGVDIETAAAMAGKLGDAGIQGQMAGTTLRAIMLKLAAPTTKAANTLKQLGVSVSDAQGNIREFPAILADLEKATSGLSKTARTEAIQAIVGTEGVSGALVLMEQAGSGALQKFAQGLRKGGSAAEVAAKKQETLDGAVKGLQSAFEGLQLAVYKTINGALAEYVNKAADIVRGISDWTKRHETLTSWIVKAGVAVGGLTSAIIPMMVVFNAMKLVVSLVQGVFLGFRAAVFACQGAMLAYRAAVVTATTATGAATVAQKAFQFVMGLGPKVFGLAKLAVYAFNAALLANPFGVVFAALSVLIAGVVWAYNKFDWFRNGVLAVWESIKGVWNKVAGWFGKDHKTELTLTERAKLEMASRKTPEPRAQLAQEEEGVTPAYGDADVLDVPELARGGIIPKPTLAMIGEGNETEAVIPLSKLQSMLAASAANSESPMQKLLRMPADRLASAGSAPSFSVQFAPVINITGAAAEDAYESVTRALTEGRQSFEREFTRFMSEKRRLSFA